MKPDSTRADRAARPTANPRSRIQSPRPTASGPRSTANGPRPTTFTHLHVRSWFSFLGGGSSPEDLVAEAARKGMTSLALTDVNGVYGAVRFQRACRLAGIRSIIGAEVLVEGETLVLLAASRDGYSNLCRMLTSAHLKSREKPVVSLEDLERFSDDLFCLTGTRGSRLWRLIDARHEQAAAHWIGTLKEIFGPRLSIELAHHLLPDDSRRLRRLVELATKTDTPIVATGDVRHATPDDYKRYDLLTCIREGITVFDPHPARPQNAEAYLKSEQILRRLIPYPEAFDRAAEIAAACEVNLLPEYLTPPAARIPANLTAEKHIKDLCHRALLKRYGGSERRKAAMQLQKELDVICHLDLEEFFLVVHEIVSEARRRGIRCAGRGSAANSIVAYLLGITAVDPLAHNLLFERFMHSGRKGTPDIDVDFDSERREEIIAWMEERFGIEQTAMTATLITYRLRSALRDVAKALGWSLDEVNRLGKSVPHGNARDADFFRNHLRQVLGASPLLETLVDMTCGLDGCPRHLGLHSGGMVLSRTPLHQFTPIQVSANGVKEVQFDKDDVEALGLIKFDVLGLRMLATINEADELVQRYEKPDFDMDSLPLDDRPTFNMIRAGKTVGVFQIESQGQLHLLAQNQPDDFNDLITEIALFRPGPLQAGMVHPFVRRRRGQEPISYMHPDLAPVLEDTYGVILFQEQVLEVAHHFAGMPLDQADEFRRLMSRFRDPGEMEGMRDKFVSGAVRRGIDEESANSVFDKVANFVGYGFCRSHAAAFAKTVYLSAYLKRHYPASFMAALMQHHPGMYNLMTLEEEARRMGVQTLMPDVNRSGLRYDLEPGPNGRLAIRKPFTSIAQIGEDDVRKIVWERMLRPFESVEDMYRRVALDVDQFRTLARSGALDSIAGDSRKALWEVGLLARRMEQPGGIPTPALFAPDPVVRPEDIPALPELELKERVSWDYEMHGTGRVHPISLLRRTLNEMEIRPISTTQSFGRDIPLNGRMGLPMLTVAGIVILRQQPPTAKGVLFVTLEDETGFIQCIVQPQTREHLDHILTEAALIVRGKIHVMGNWRGFVVTQAWRLDGIFGGYAGYASAEGKDRWVRSAETVDR